MRDAYAMALGPPSFRIRQRRPPGACITARTYMPRDFVYLGLSRGVSLDT